MSQSFLSGRRRQFSKTNYNSRLIVAAASALLIKTGLSSAAATWTGTAGSGGSVISPTSGNWNTGGNWSPGSVPVSSTTTALDFLGSSSTYTATDNISGVFQLNSMVLGAGNATIAAATGSSISFAGTTPLIQQTNSGTVSLTLPIALTSNTAIQQTNGGVLNISGAVTTSNSSGLTLTNSTGSGNTSVNFTGANTFGGLTVNANVTAAAGLSSNTTQLGSGNVTLNGGTLLLQGQESAPGAPVQSSIGVTGFNADTIVDAAGTANPTASSTGTALSGIDNATHGNFLFQSGYLSDTNGVPSSGVIKSSITNVSGQKSTFILGYNGTTADFVDNNTLRFTATGESHTLTLTTPAEAKTIDILACAQNANSTFDVTFTFADNSTDTYTEGVTTGQWAFGSSPPTNLAFTNTHNVGYASSINSWNFYLTESDITLDAADANKTIDSVSFTNDSLNGGNSAEIYALAGTVVSTGQVLSSQNYANNLNITANSTINVSASLAATMGNLSIGGNKLSIASSDTTGAAYNLTLGTASITGNATINVAASTSGGAGTLNLGALGDGGSAHTITFNSTGNGTINLASPATSLVAGTVINLSGGTLNSSNATAIGSSSTVNMSTGATLNISTSEQLSALNGTGGAVNIGANTLTIGSTDNLNSNYSGTITGAGTVLTPGTGSVVLGGANTYSGTSINSNGQNVQTSLLVNQGVAVIAGASTGYPSAVFTSPAGTGAIAVNPTGGTAINAELALDNTPGRTLYNSINIFSANNGNPILAGLNTSGTTTFAGAVTLGTGSSGDFGHNLTVAGTAGGEVDFTGNIIANGGSTHSGIAVNNLSGSGNTTVKFTGNNTYAGGTTVNVGATLAAGLSLSPQTLGTGTITLAGGNLSLQGQLPVGAQQAVTIDGYNADTILDSAATTGLNSSTGVSTSNIDGSNLFFENGYASNSTNGLPANGVVVSNSTGHSFQLAPYTGLNTIRLTAADKTAGQTVTIDPNSAVSKFQTLDFLSTGMGACTFTVKLTFSDSTSATIGAVSTSDWYGGNPATNAITGLDPVTQNAAGDIQDFGGALTIQENDITLPTADQGKTVSSITFTPITLGASADIYAIDAAAYVPAVALGTQTYANNLNITQDTSIDVSGSLNAVVGNVGIGTNSLGLTSVDTTSSAYSLTTGTVTFFGTGATFNVINSAGNGAGTLVLGSLNDNGAVQMINKIGVGTLTLSAPATSMVNGTIVNVEAGTLNANGAGALGTFAAVNVASGATFGIGAAQQIGSLADYGSPVVNGSAVALNGNTLTIGTITDASSTYSGKIVDGTGSPGASGIIKAGTGTLTLVGASTYSGTTSVQLGTVLAMNTTGSATGTSAVTVANDAQAFLGGTGSIAGSVSVTGNGTIFTGTYPDTATAGKTSATLHIGTGSNLSGNSLLDITGINASDEIVVGNGTGSVTFGGTLNVADIDTTAYAIGQQYNLFSFGSETGTFGTLNLPTLPSNLSWDTSHLYTPGNGYIDVTAAGPSTLVWDNHLSSTGDGITWDNGIGGKSQNWNSNGTAASFSSDQPVTFNDNNNGHYLVNLASNVLPSSVAVNSANTYTIESTNGFVIDDYDPNNPTTLSQSGGGTLNIENANTFSGATTVTGTGTHLHLTSTGEIASNTLTVGTGASAQIDGLLVSTPTLVANGNVNLGVSDGNNNPTAGILERDFTTISIGSGAKVAVAKATAASTATLITTNTLTDNGTLDLSNNKLLINYGSGPDPIASVAALLASGYNGGAWNGPGIDTSAPVTINGLTYGLGYADGADKQHLATGLASGTIEIKYTLLGDADLNGIVNGIDFGILAANFNKGITGWDEGDFDYNNIVNGLDFGDLAANFNKGAAIAGNSASAADFAALDAFAAANGLLADVPEPATIGLIAVGACGLIARRRRK